MADDLGKELFKERLKILGEMGNLTKEINAFNEAGLVDIIKTNALNKERLKLAKELRSVNEQIRNEQRKLYVAATKSVNELGSLYDNLKKSDSDRIKMMRSAGDLSDIAVERGNTLSDINQKIAQLTSDQSLEREILQDQFDLEIKKLQKQKGISDEILNNLKEQNETARAYSDLTEGQKEQLQSQIAAYDTIKKTIGGILDTASLLTRGPAGFFGSALIGAGMFADKLGEVRSQLGGISDVGTTALSFIDDNAVENIKSLSDEFGGISNVSTQLQASTSLISKNMGITGGEAASLVGSFARLNGNSTDVALDMTKTTQEFAKQNGIIPSKLMGDLAGSAEEFALFGKDGGDNILQAAGYAQKLGVNMKTISGIADNLLDFESSITKELELSALLGKNINLDKARGLAMSGDLEGATKETLKALGGQAAFNKMDYFQKKASADLLGVSVAELDKMVNNQEEAAKLAGTLAGQFSLAGEAVDGVLNKGLGTSLKGIGGMVIAAGQLNNGFGIFGVNLKGIVSGTAQILKNILGMVAGPVLKAMKSLTSPLMDSFGGTAVSKGLTSFKDKLLQGVGGKVTDVAADSGGGIVDKLKDKVGEGVEGAADSVNKDKSMGDKLKDLSKGLKAMGNTQVLFGALNLIPTALGFISILPGIPGMLAIASIGVPAAVGLRGLASGLKAFGKAAPEALIGIGLLALFGVALIPFTYALSLLAPLVISIGTAIGSVIESIGKGIASIVTSIGDLLVKVLPLLNLEAAVGILAMAAAFTVLAGSLALLSTLGTAAIPVLLAVGAVGAIGSMLIGGDESAGAEGGGEGGSMSALLDEIKGLRADLNSGKVAVYLDGKKVTSTVARVANTSSVNTYAKR